MRSPAVVSNNGPPNIRVGRLNSANYVRRETARLYKDARVGKIDAGDASKLATLLQLLLRTIESSDLESRVEKLETAR